MVRQLSWPTITFSESSLRLLPKAGSWTVASWLPSCTLRRLLYGLGPWRGGLSAEAGVQVRGSDLRRRLRRGTRDAALPWRPGDVFLVVVFFSLATSGSWVLGRYSPTGQMDPRLATLISLLILLPG